VLRGTWLFPGYIPFYIHDSANGQVRCRSRVKRRRVGVNLPLTLTLTLILTLALTLILTLTLTLTNPNQALCQAAATFFARPSFYHFVVCALNALLTG